MSKSNASLTRPDQDVFHKVLQALSTFHQMSPGLTRAFSENIFNVHLAKKEYLIKQGEISKNLYFLVRGVVTGYRTHRDKKLTTFISIDGDFVSAIEGMYGTAPSKDNIIASEDCYLLGLKSEVLQDMFIKYPEMNAIMRKILEVYYCSAHERSVVIRVGTAKEKYEYYLKSITGQSDRVPTDLVASFLNMKIGTLEKIKKELKLENKEKEPSKSLLELETAMENEKLFMSKRINLHKVASYLQITAHDLSHLLNYHYQKSFSDYVNMYRIEFVKKQLESELNLRRLTIEGIGELAGFSSKSTFFSAFRKNTGFSPLAYSQILKKQHIPSPLSFAL